MINTVYEIDNIIKKLENIYYNLQYKNQDIDIAADPEIPTIDISTLRIVIDSLVMVRQQLVDHPQYQKEHDENYL